MKKLKNTDFLALGRGKIKMCQWENQNEEVIKLFEKYYKEDEKINHSPSFVFCSRNEKMKEILLEIIEKFDSEISNHFTGEIYDKNSAREYVLKFKE